MFNKPKSVYENGSLMYTAKQASKVSYLAQYRFTAFGEEAQLISCSLYAERENLSRLTSLGSIIVCSRWQAANDNNQWITIRSKFSADNCYPNHVFSFFPVQTEMRPMAVQFIHRLTFLACVRSVDQRFYC